MICDPCKVGGFCNAELTRYPHLPLAQKELAEAALVNHCRCKGGTQCDCQHFIGQALNQEAIREHANPEP